MTYAYPAPLPFPEKINSVRLDLDPVATASRSRGGLVQAVSGGRPLWLLEVSTGNLKGPSYAAMRVFIAAQEGGIRVFSAYDTMRKRPQAYPGKGWTGFVRAGGSDPFDGKCTVNEATDPSVFKVKLTGLPDGFILTPGDLISWAWSNSRTLHMMIVGGTANSSGELEVEVRPDIPPGTSFPATAKLEKPDAYFMLTENPEMRRNGPTGLPVTIKAIQYLA